MNKVLHFGFPVHELNQHDKSNGCQLGEAQEGERRDSGKIKPNIKQVVLWVMEYVYYF